MQKEETNNLTPAEIFAPGEILQDELDARGWTQRDFGEITGLNQSVLSLLINGKRAITPEIAKAIAEAFGTSAEFWLNLENAYQLAQVKFDGGSVAQKAMLYSLAPIAEMAKRGWIEQVKTPAELQFQLKRFFETDDLSHIPDFAMVARKSTSYDIVSVPERAWKFRARRLAKAVHAATFDADRFARELPKFRSLTVYPENLRKLPALLASFGIRLVLVAHLERTKLDGATMWLDEERKQPVVALTLRYDRIDSFWFTLIHELVHVKYKECSIDSDMLSDAKGEGGAGTDDASGMEKRANDEASDILVPPEKLKSFIMRTRPLYSRDKILGFSQLHGVHPGIVVGQLHHRKEMPPKNLRELLIQKGVRDLIAGQALTDGWGHFPGAF